MRRWATLAATLLLLLAVWRLTPRATQHEPRLAEVTESAGLHDEVDLLEPEQFSSPASDPGSPSARDDAPPTSRRSKLSPDRSPEPPKRAAVRGRLRVAETGDPIEESMSIRLRTIDLTHKESLVTCSDGTFTSAEPYLDGALLARVTDSEGRELVDHEGVFDPASTDEWPVYVPTRTYPTFVRGHVVDRRGKPLGEVRVQLVPLQPWGPYVEHLSDEDGRFELEDLRAGNFRLHLQGLWARSAPLELALHAGLNDLGDVVLSEPHTAELIVRFVTAEGEDEGFPDALLVLRPSSSQLAVPFYDYTAEERGGDLYELRLERVPAEECTLTLESLDGRTYKPARFVLTPPAEIEVHVGGPPREGLLMRVHDAHSGAPILAYERWSRRRGLWVWENNGIAVRPEESTGELELRGAEAWVVLAEAHRARRGTSDPHGTGVVEVALEPGWSELLLFEDLEGDSFGNIDYGLRRTWLTGVEVFVDGVSVGRSDADGQYLLEVDAPPKSLEFRLPGWRVLRNERRGELRMVGLIQSP